MKLPQWIITLTVFRFSYSEEITAVTLNNGYLTSNQLWDTSADIDCLHTNLTIVRSFPAEVSICYRSFPMNYVGDTAFTTVIGFGTMRSDFPAMGEGFLFGIWKNGAWLGVMNETETSYRWVSLGDNFLLDTQIWRHTCFSLNFTNGQCNVSREWCNKVFSNFQDNQEKSFLHELLFCRLCLWPYRRSPVNAWNCDRRPYF